MAALRHDVRHDNIYQRDFRGAKSDDKLSQSLHGQLSAILWFNEAIEFRNDVDRGLIDSQTSREEIH